MQQAVQTPQSSNELKQQTSDLQTSDLRRATHITRTRDWRQQRGFAATALIPSAKQLVLSLLTALLLVLSFPDFDLSWLAWFALVPLFVAVVQSASGIKGFLLGWFAGTIFFFGSCWWLTYSMIHYGGFPVAVAYLFLLPITLIVGLFSGLAMLLLGRAAARWGSSAAVLLAAPLWIAFEWLRFTTTGQLWNALGYSQAFHPFLIQAASWGGVYAVGFLLAAVNAAIACLIVNGKSRLRGSLKIFAAIIASVALIIWFSGFADDNLGSVYTIPSTGETRAVVIAVQPNVSINFRRSPSETARLTQMHFDVSRRALQQWEQAAMTQAANSARFETEREANIEAVRNIPRLVVFPESPMNFQYARSAAFREMIGGFARENRTAVLFNSLEPAGSSGAYNAAVLVDAQGFYTAQYDKIRLLPFGEYVPLPKWLPGSSSIGAVVGEFTPGKIFTLLPVGDLRAGAFICYESAFPEIAREMTRSGAQMLINISNDAYLGATPVMRQHLANAVFRAVENRREVLRVTNTGISARINSRGRILDETQSFQPAVKTWTITGSSDDKTFYTRYGDLFVALPLFLTFVVLAKTIRFKPLGSNQP